MRTPHKTAHSKHTHTPSSHLTAHKHMRAQVFDFKHCAQIITRHINLCDVHSAHTHARMGGMCPCVHVPVEWRKFVGRVRADAIV